MCIHLQLDMVNSMRNGDVHKSSVITVKKNTKNACRHKVYRVYIDVID